MGAHGSYHPVNRRSTHEIVGAVVHAQQTTHQSAPGVNNSLIRNMVMEQPCEYLISAVDTETLRTVPDTACEAAIQLNKLNQTDFPENRAASRQRLADTQGDQRLDHGMLSLHVTNTNLRGQITQQRLPVVDWLLCQEASYFSAPHRRYSVRARVEVGAADAAGT
jgi:hypothetical protein